MTLGELVYIGVRLVQVLGIMLVGLGLLAVIVAVARIVERRR